MVIDDRKPDDSDEPRDRGQLVLIAAVSIGLVIMGLVVVINTILVAENISTSESLETTDEVTKFSATVRDNTRGLIIRLNHRARNMTAAGLTRDIHRNISNYSRALAVSYARSGIAIVNISYNNESSVWGNRIVQTRDGYFTTPNITSGSTTMTGGCTGIVSPPNARDLDDACAEVNQSDWQVVNTTNVRRFIVNLNVSASTNDAMNVTFTNRSGEYVNVSLRVDRTGRPRVEISSERSLGGNVTDVYCDPSGNRVLVNLMSGRAFTGDCTFNGVLNRTNASRSLAPPFNVSIHGGDNAYGQFSLVTNRTVNLFNGTLDANEFGEPRDAEAQFYEFCADGTATNPVSRSDPCHVPVVWQANVTATYQSTSIDYWQEHNVSVYP